MIRPKETPVEWTDRKMVFSDRNGPLAETISYEDDARVRKSVNNLTVVAFDPGGTTGWSVMKLSYEDLMDQQKPVHEAIHTWYHGQVDCGSQSGNAGDSATANSYDLGISETGEAAGVAILSNIIRQQARPAFGGLGTAVVYEDFIIRQSNMSRDFLSPVRVTAALQQTAWESRLASEFKQQPSEAKTAITDDRLKTWKMYYDGSAARHARDADRHALLFLRKARQKKGRIREAWPVVALAKDRGIL